MCTLYKYNFYFVKYIHINTIVSGAFLAIPVPDFFRYVRNLPKSAVVPNTRGSYTSWEKRILYHRMHGVLVIYKYVFIPLSDIQFKSNTNLLGGFLILF